MRIIPKNNVYILEAVYEREETTIEVNNRITAIDIGLNNLATVSSNCLDFQPFIVCGKAIKSCNQFYNKVKIVAMVILRNSGVISTNLR